MDKQLQQPSNSADFQPIMTDRKLIKVILFSMITFGIYGIIFFTKLGCDLNRIASKRDNKKTMNYLLILLLTPFTAGIAQIVWFHKLSNRIADEEHARGIQTNFSAKSFWLWCVLGSLIIVGPYAFVYKLCVNMNVLANRYNEYGYDYEACQLTTVEVADDTAGKVRRFFIGTFSNAVLWIFSLTCIFPLIWMGYSSLKLKREFNADPIGLPKDIKFPWSVEEGAKHSFSNYHDLLTNADYDLPSSIMNSVYVTICSVFFIVLFGFIVGYILSRVKFKLNRPMYLMFLMGMLIPIHSLLVPIYIVFRNVPIGETGLIGQWYTLVIPYVAFGLPMAIFLVEGFVKGIPTALEEAAAIDGSSFSRTLFSIIMPICRPIMVTVGIINIFSCWNEFSFALVLQFNAKAYWTVNTVYGTVLL